MKSGRDAGGMVPDAERAMYRCEIKTANSMKTTACNPSSVYGSPPLHGTGGDADKCRPNVECYAQVINNTEDEMDEPEYRAVSDEFQEAKMHAPPLTFSKVAACKHLRR